MSGPGSRGGSGRLFAERAAHFNVPQHDIDGAIVQSAMASNRQWCRAMLAKHIQGGPDSLRCLRHANATRRFLLDVARALAASPFATLSPKQRIAALACCPLAIRGRLARPGAPTPLSVGPLPLKPPRARREGDE